MFILKPQDFRGYRACLVRCYNGFNSTGGHCLAQPLNHPVLLSEIVKYDVLKIQLGTIAKRLHNKYR